jgi:hypothetical protein
LPVTPFSGNFWIFLTGYLSDREISQLILKKNKNQKNMKNFTLAIFAFLAAAANAVHLRQSSLMAEDDLELAETEQSFRYSTTHDCQFVTRRLKDVGYTPYADQVAALGSYKWTDSSFEASSEGIQWADYKTGSNGDLSTYKSFPWKRLTDYCDSTGQICTLFGDNGCTVDDIR